MLSPKYGYWEVFGHKFNNKFLAFSHASALNKLVHFKYHNDVWENFDRKLLGKIPLNTLYKERAQQLRNRYQYLILNYSGGADSHNILRTFIDNNIKLDEICVFWPKPLSDGKFYTANNIDSSVKNRWSEWDYSIKPTLKWISKNYPKIKIHIKDYVGDPNKIDIAGLFDKLNHTRTAGMLLTSSVSDSDNIQSSRGLSVGHIAGIDKPLLSWNDGCISMFFTDMALSMITAGGSSNINAECFYWAPDYPLLTFEMAYQMSIHFDLYPVDKQYLFKYDSNIPIFNRSAFQHELAIKTCYTTWDHRFQTGKMKSPDAGDKYFWFNESIEFENIRKNYKILIEERFSSINNNLLANPNSLNTLATKAFKINT
jgi:hypothetical protein